MQAERWSFLGFVFGGDETQGFIFVARAASGLFLGNVVFAVQGAPPPQTNTP